jgi:hypothetical protein
LIVPRARSPFAAVLADLKHGLAALRVDWYVFGAQAALIYGAARITADVDVTVRLGKVTPTRLVATLKRHGFELRVKDRRRRRAQHEGCLEHACDGRDGARTE